MIASMVGLHLRLRGGPRVDNGVTAACAEIARPSLPSETPSLLFSAKSGNMAAGAGPRGEDHDQD
jgi:hypothetical protein